MASNGRPPHHARQRPPRASAFIHRFDSNLNADQNFHVCAVDWVFEKATGSHWTSLKRVVVTVSYRCHAGLRPAPYL